MACQKGSETRACRQRPHPRRIAHAQPMMGAVEQRKTSPEERRPLGCCHDRSHRNGKDDSPGCSKRVVRALSAVDDGQFAEPACAPDELATMFLTPDRTSYDQKPSG